MGSFIFTVPLKGNIVLSVTSIGYEDYNKQIALADADLILKIVMRPNTTQLGGVVVSAGAFEASDKAKGVSLTPMDAVTVTGNGADVGMSLRALPGAQQVGQSAGNVSGDKYYAPVAFGRDKEKARDLLEKAVIILEKESPSSLNPH